MEITIKRYSRKMTYEDAATLDEFGRWPSAPSGALTGSSGGIGTGASVTST